MRFTLALRLSLAASLAGGLACPLHAQVDPALGTGLPYVMPANPDIEEVSTLTGLAIQTAIDTVSVDGGIVVLAPGSYLIDVPLVIDTAKPVYLRGAGADSSGIGGTDLFWRGAGGALFELDGLQNCRFEGFSIFVENNPVDPKYLDTAFDCRAADRDSFNLTFLGVQLNGGPESNNRIGTGFRFSQAGTHVNTKHYFERINIQSFDATAYAFDNDTAHGHLFVQCGFDPRGQNIPGPQHGITAAQPGGFTWIGGGGTGTKDSAIRMPAPSSPVVFDGFNIEDARTLLETNGVSNPLPAPVRFLHARLDVTDDVLPLLIDWPEGELSIESSLLDFHQPFDVDVGIEDEFLVLGCGFFDQSSTGPVDPTQDGSWPTGSNVSVVGCVIDGNAAMTPATLVPETAALAASKRQPANAPIPAPRDVTDFVEDRLGSGFVEVTGNTADDILAGLGALGGASGQGGTLYLNAGGMGLPFSIDKTIRVELDGPVRIIGAPGTVLEWQPVATDDSMFELFGMRESEFRDFRITVASGAVLEHGIEIWNLSPMFPNRLSSRNAFYNVEIEAGAGALDYGFALEGNQNNDFHYFERCSVSGHSKAGWSLENAQSKTNLMVECSVTAGPASDFGVTNEEGTGGSFLWFGGQITGHQNAAFNLSRAVDVVAVQGGSYVGNSQLMASTNTSGAIYPVALENLRFETDSSNQGTYPNAVSFRFPGPLLVRDAIFRTTHPTEQITLNVDLSTPNQGVLLSMNSDFLATESIVPVLAGDHLTGPMNPMGANLTAHHDLNRGWALAMHINQTATQHNIRIKIPFGQGTGNVQVRGSRTGTSPGLWDGCAVLPKIEDGYAPIQWGQSPWYALIGGGFAYKVVSIDISGESGTDLYHSVALRRGGETLLSTQPIMITVP